MPKREHWSTWYPGTEEAWKALTYEERTALSFAATGCTIAYPTWKAPVDCVHGTCQVQRGEIHPMILVNGQLRAEAESGWLRFATRERKARIFRALRTHCRREKVYDIWKVPGGWAVLVYGGVMA